jgi:hypothetical protein
VSVECTPQLEDTDFRPRSRSAIDAEQVARAGACPDVDCAAMLGTGMLPVPWYWAFFETTSTVLEGAL